MKPYTEHLAAWHVHLARLRGAIESSHTPARCVFEAAEELRREIRVERLKLQATISGLPPKVAQNSRVMDTKRALISMAEIIEDLRTRASRIH